MTDPLIEWSSRCATFDEAAARFVARIRDLLARTPRQSDYVLCCPEGEPMPDQTEDDRLEALFRAAAGKCHEIAARYAVVGATADRLAYELKLLEGMTVLDEDHDSVKPNPLLSSSLKCDHEAHLSRLNRLTIDALGRGGVWDQFGAEFTVKADAIALGPDSPEAP